MKIGYLIFVIGIVGFLGLILPNVFAQYMGENNSTSLGERIGVGLTRDITWPPPLKQIKELEFEPERVRCNSGFELTFKTLDNSPACVKLGTVEKLIKRGWAQLDKVTVYIFGGNIPEQDFMVGRTLDNPHPFIKVINLFEEPVIFSGDYSVFIDGIKFEKSYYVSGKESVKIIPYKNLKRPNGTNVTPDQISEKMDFANAGISSSLAIKDDRIGATWIVTKQKYDYIIEPRLDEIYQILFESSSKS